MLSNNSKSRLWLTAILQRSLLCFPDSLSWSSLPIVLFQVMTWLSLHLGIHSTQESPTSHLLLTAILLSKVTMRLFVQNVHQSVRVAVVNVQVISLHILPFPGSVAIFPSCTEVIYVLKTIPYPGFVRWLELLLQNRWYRQEILDKTLSLP